MPKLPKPKRRGLRTWIEIDKKKAKKNFKALKKILSPNTKFGAVTKSNAYGHGLVGYSRLMEEFGADWILVDSIMEARTLRRERVKQPILVLGYTLPENFSLAIKNKVSLTISSFENLKIVSNKKIRIHLKFDTGMSRQGFLKKDLNKIFKLIKNKPVIIEGIYTHFAKAKVPKERGETDKQLKEFLEIKKAFEDEGYKPIVHAGATSGGIVYNDSHFDMVRFGIGIYGLWPEKAVKKSFEKPARTSSRMGGKLKLEPVLSWKTIVSEVKELPKGSGVGYDLTYTLKRKSKVAVCPVGYWHGYLRALSNKSDVLVRGKRARLLGRVSMGMIVVDVTQIPNVKVGDVVTLIGKDGRSEVTADELADLAGTINYEIVTRINPLSRRFYI